MSSSLFASIREPIRKKKSFKLKQQEDTVVLPLPIPLVDSIDKNVEKYSKLLSGSYSAILKDNRVIVEEEWMAKCIYNCGYFGHGEYSRGEPNLNRKQTVNDNDQVEEYSINNDNLIQLSKEKYQHRNEWSLIKMNFNDQTESRHIDNVIISNQEDEFHIKFLHEFVKKSTNEIDSSMIKYCKISDVNRRNQTILINEQDSTNKEEIPRIVKNFLKSPSTDLFSSIRIKKLPSCELKENLILMYEEAFFLSFGLDCLTVFNHEYAEFKLDELWKKFLELDKNFPFKYAVYHKLRSKGWILKNGIKYGCDFLAYLEGPDKYHASYSIRVKRKDLKKLREELKNEELNIEDFQDETETTFTQFAAFLRINETASKQVMFCYVIYDTEKEEVNLNDVSCLASFSVMESLIERWVPKENRDRDSQVTSSNSKHELNKSEGTFHKHLEYLDQFDDNDD